LDNTPEVVRALAVLVDAVAERLAPAVAALVVERMQAMASAVEAPVGLVDRRDAARAVGVSVATLDRLARDGAPVHRVGARRRFDVVELRAWLEARGRRPAAPRAALPPPRDDVDDAEVIELAAAAGIRSR
jgi:hypothetical protein